MGSGASTSRSPSSSSPSSSPPEGIKKLNDSVFELYPGLDHPEGQADPDPELEVIFFHGLQLDDYEEAYWKTWLSRDGTVVWPKAWLGPSLQRARILSISYDSSAQISNKAGRTRMYQIIENLVHNIVESARCGQDRKVILVGHSLGGIIIKEFLLKCNATAGRLDSDSDGDRKHRLKTFLRNCSGVFYYATPHGGSRLVEYAAQASLIPGIKLNMPIIQFLKVLSSETAVINNNFSNFRKTKKLKAKTATIAESLPTQFGPLSGVVVEEAAARYDTDNHYTAQADHFDVCKPKDDTTNIFTNLRDFCKQSMETSLEERFTALNSKKTQPKPVSRTT